MAGPAGIPFTAINAYATRYGIEGDAFDRFLALIQRMDAAILKWMQDKAKQEEERRGTQ